MQHQYDTYKNVEGGPEAKYIAFQQQRRGSTQSWTHRIVSPQLLWAHMGEMCLFISVGEISQRIVCSYEPGIHTAPTWRIDNAYAWRECTGTTCLSSKTQSDALTMLQPFDVEHSASTVVAAAYSK